MKNPIPIASAIVVFFFASIPSARTAAFNDLSGNYAASGYLAAPPSDIQPPQELKILPDDTVREDPPTGKEIIPVWNNNQKISGGDNMDPQHIIPADLRAAALEYYYSNQDKIGNLRYIGVLDFAKHSSLARFYIADTIKGTVKVIHAAHGSGSDPDNDGYATLFSNIFDSKTSSLGPYITGEIYYGKHGRSMRLHGLSAANSNAYERAIVIHAADYVSDDNVQPGRSWGCPAVSPANIGSVIATLQNGALIYAGLSGAR